MTLLQEKGQGTGGRDRCGQGHPSAELVLSPLSSSAPSRTRCHRSGDTGDSSPAAGDAHRSPHRGHGTSARGTAHPHGAPAPPR